MHLDNPPPDDSAAYGSLGAFLAQSSSSPLLAAASSSKMPPPRPPLYPAGAIRGFCMLFSTVAGGTMIANDLRSVGQPDAARTAFWGSIIFTALQISLATLLPGTTSTAIALIAGLAGATGLNAYFSKFVANRDNFPVKSVRKPLLLCLLIFTPLTVLAVYLTWWD